MDTVPLDELGGYFEVAIELLEIVFAESADFYFCRR